MADVYDQLLAGTGFGHTPGEFAQQAQQLQAAPLEQALGQLRLVGGVQQLQAAQQAQQQDAAFQRDVAAYSAEPTPDALYKLSLKYPDKAKALRDADAGKNDAQRQSDLTTYGGLHAAASGGNFKLVGDLLKQRRDAEAAAGVDTTELDNYITELASNNPEALKHVEGFALAKIYSHDPEGFVKTFKPDTNAQHFANTPQGDIYDQRDGTVTYSAGPKPEVDTVKVFDENGAYVGSRRITHPPVGVVSGGQIEQLALNAVPGATVTSRARSPEHNADVGGVPNSYHLTDQARDLTPPAGMSMALFHNTLQAALPGVKVINEGNHVHIQPMPRNTASGFPTKPAGPVGASSLLDAPTRALLAEQYLAGDTSVLVGLGRSKENMVAMRQEIAKQAKAQGMNGADVAARLVDFKATVAAERATGTRIANVDLAATEAQRLAPLALKASSDLPRSGWLTAGKLQEAIRNQTNDPRLGKFVAANNGFVNAYSRAISPSGVPTVSGTEHAREMLSTAAANGRYDATVQQMLQEIEAAKSAPRSVRADIKAGVAGVTAPRGVPSDIAAILKKYGH